MSTQDDVFFLQIWTENAQGFQGAVNFITGMGGFLQSILNGYFGIRVRRDKFEFKPNPIPNSDSYTIRNMRYLGNIFDASVSLKTFNLFVKFSNPSFDCNLHCHSSGRVLPFRSYTNLALGKYSLVCRKKSQTNKV